MAGERHGHGMLCVNPPLNRLSPPCYIQYIVMQKTVVLIACRIVRRFSAVQCIRSAWSVETGTVLRTGRNISVDEATRTGWTVRGSNPGGGESFRTCPDRP